MSASLVGSEMCIRDRSWPRQLLRAAPRRARSLGRPRWPRITHGERRASVSYTHLTLPTICSV
eukprot:9367891-Alexandrium_andersonii.AAC.1